MLDFLNTLEIEFQKYENTINAIAQKAYMRNKFEYFGLNANEPRNIQKPFIVKAYLQKKKI